MDMLVGSLEFLKAVRSNRIDHGDIMAFRLIPIMSKLLLWWTAEDYKTVLKWKKRVNLAFRINAVLFLAGFLIYCARHPFNKPLPNMLQDIGVCLTGLTGCCGTFVFASNRKRISKMLKAVNDMNQDILERRGPNWLENRRQSNRLFLGITIFVVIYLLLSILQIPVFFVEFAKTGVPYLQNDLFQFKPFSVFAYAITLLQTLSMVLMIYTVNTMLPILLEVLLRIAFYFRVTAGELRLLRGGASFDEQVEFLKLKKLIKDVNLFHGFVYELNRSTRFYILAFVALVFTTLGLYVAVILSIGSLQKIMEVLSFPIFLIIILGLFCGLGQKLTESADEVRIAIYDCDWHSAPAPFRELVLNLLTRCTRDTIFEATPYFVLNFELFKRVMRTTFTAFTVFANVMK